MTRWQRNFSWGNRNDTLDLKWCDMCKMYHAQNDHSEHKLLEESNERVVENTSERA